MVHAGKQKTVINFGPGPAKIPEEVGYYSFALIFYEHNFVIYRRSLIKYSKMDDDNVIYEQD